MANKVRGKWIDSWMLHTMVNVGGGVGSNADGRYGLNIIRLEDVEVYVGGKCMIDIVLTWY